MRGSERTKRRIVLFIAHKIKSTNRCNDQEKKRMSLLNKLKKDNKNALTKLLVRNNSVTREKWSLERWITDLRYLPGSKQI